MGEANDDRAEQVMPQPGAVIAGKYRLERRIGKGGMGVIFAATHIALGEQVALKFLLPQTSQDDKRLDRFLLEAKAAVRIKNEHVARVLDFGALETGEPFMVMELLVGTDLGKLVRQRGPLPVDEAVDYVLQACEAIIAAHAIGIVHRDIKPANLFLTRRENGSPLVKVLDFGISKFMGPEDAGLTSTEDVLGSPLFMSPEQVRNPKAATIRSDIWALGAILYHLLAGRSPFAAERASSVLAMVIADEPTPITDLRADVKPALAAVIRRCLEKHPERRFQQVDELKRALLPLAASTPPPGIDTLGPAVPDVTAQLVGSATGSLRSAAERRAWLLRGGGVAVVFASVQLLVSRMPGREPREAPSSAVAMGDAATTARASDATHTTEVAFALAGATAPSAAAPLASASTSPPSPSASSSQRSKAGEPATRVAPLRRTGTSERSAPVSRAGRSDALDDRY